MRVQQTKTADTRLEDFVDWTGVVEGEPAEEKEMFSLTIEFSARMRKRSTTLEGEAALVLERRDLGGLLQMRGLRKTRP